MARARNIGPGPGTILEYEIQDHGVEHAQYFQGCGIAHTRWNDVGVGSGSTPLEAYEDAAEQLASAGWDPNTLPERPRGISQRSSISEDEAEHYGDEGERDVFHYVCVYVRGSLSPRIESSRQRRSVLSETLPSLYEELKAAGIKMDSHESDLYVQETPAVRGIIAQFPMHAKNATRFRDRRDGKMWIDVPFAYDPWWNKRKRKK